MTLRSAGAAFRQAVKEESPLQVIGAINANQGQNMIFTVFAAAVIGGVSLEGGKGTVFGAFTGVLVLGLINNILLLAGVPAQWTQAINGLIIILALVLARLTSGKAQD